MLTVLLPVTRPWSREAVCAAIGASDIPRGRLLLVLDAPGCGKWAADLKALGFKVGVTKTGNPDPPDGRVARRTRHREMRRLTQTIVPDGPLLCLEDDTLVPPDVYERLTLAGPNATGVQLSRFDSARPGIDGAARTYGISPIRACGHYCLLTTGEAYKAAKVPERGVVDWGHTAGIQPLVVDWDCHCGHLTEDSMLHPVKRTVWGALVHMYPPKHMAGGEMMFHSIFTEAVRRGVECRVAVEPDIGSYVHEGVQVGGRELLEGCDVVFTHLDRTSDAEAYTRTSGQPLVHVMHNHLRPGTAKKCELAVYNSDWLRQGYPCSAPSIVIHPPVWPDWYETTPGMCVTLLNLSRAKGAEILFALARRMPDLEFLGVRGAYGEQMTPPELPNLTVIDTKVDVREVYKRTRVLLMPSSYESYGRCAVEAAVSGIPTIAHHTEGLREALGSGGVYPDRLDAPHWEQALREVLADWPRYSARARLRVWSMDPAHDVSRLIGAVDTLVRPRGGHASEPAPPEKTYRLGVPVQFMGRTYHTGDRVAEGILREMYAAGLIKDQRFA